MHESLMERVRVQTAALVAAGRLVRLVCPSCSAEADLRPENPNVDSYHCSCSGAPTRMVRS